MQLEEVRVRGFRNIEDSGWVDINENITTLVGKNESGKTSFLEAISRLGDTDEIKDSDINNEMSPVDGQFPVVEASLSVDKDFDISISENVNVYKRKDGEIRSLNNLGLDRRDSIILEDLIRSLEDTAGVSHSDVRVEEPLEKLEIESLEDKIASKQSNSKEILESIDNAPNEVKSSKFGEELERTRKHLRDHDPQIMSIDEYLPSIILSKSTKMISNKFNINEGKDSIFQKMLKIGNINYKKHSEKKPRKKMRDETNVEDTIEKLLNSFWDQKSVDIRLNYDEKLNRFSMLIQDNKIPSCDQYQTVNRGLVLPSQRSNGFRWFLSFLIDISSKEDNLDVENSIYLIDDPALSLHPQGKKDWLEAIESLTDNAQFLYSTHSPFLIDETRPDRIRAVEDHPDERTNVTSSMFEGDRETLQPLRNALGIGLGDSPFANRRKLLIEGPSDYFILSGVLHYFSEYEDDAPLVSGELTLFPVDGADEMPEAGRWMHSEEFAFAFLLDHDDKGKQIKQDIEDDELLDANNAFFLKHKRAKNSYNVEIEDMFHPEFYVECVNEVYSRDRFCSNVENGDNDIDNFNLNQIEVAEALDGWIIGDGEEYKGMKIASKVEAEFSNQGYDSLELDKLRVAKEIQNRLERGEWPHQGDVEAFKRVLGNMHNVLYAN